VWRTTVYWTELVDRVVFYYRDLLEYVYKNFSKLKVPPGKPRFMCLDELKAICVDMELAHHECFNMGEDPMVAYNLSMMTVVENLEKEKE